MITAEDGCQSANKDLVSSLSQAFRWQKLLEAGDIATLSDLARQEKVALSWVSRLMRLTLLSPRLVEAILDGDLGDDLTVSKLAECLSLDWAEQEKRLVPNDHPPEEPR